MKKMKKHHTAEFHKKGSIFHQAPQITLFFDTPCIYLKYQTEFDIVCPQYGKKSRIYILHCVCIIFTFQFQALLLECLDFKQFLFYQISSSNFIFDVEYNFIFFMENVLLLNEISFCPQILNSQTSFRNLFKGLCKDKVLSLQIQELNYRSNNFIYFTFWESIFFS